VKAVAAAAIVWIGTDGEFHLASHEHFETAEEHAEALSEEGLPTQVLYRDDLVGGRP
jgi:hypothetical protein